VALELTVYSRIYAVPVTHSSVGSPDSPVA